MTSSRTALGISITAAALLTMPHLVRAQTTEWRVIGPAASWHSHTVGAPSHAVVAASGTCAFIPNSLTAAPVRTSSAVDLFGSKLDVERTTEILLLDDGKRVLEIPKCAQLPAVPGLAYRLSQCEIVQAGVPMMFQSSMRIHSSARHSVSAGLDISPSSATLALRGRF